MGIIRLNLKWKNYQDHSFKSKSSTQLLSCQRLDQSTLQDMTFMLLKPQRCQPEVKSIPTGIAMAIPEGNYGRIAPRSGLAAKHSIDVGAGVIDSDYRGEVKVLLFNLSDVDFNLKANERIAQLIIEKYTPTDIAESRTLTQPSEEKED